MRSASTISATRQGNDEEMLLDGFTDTVSHVTKTILLEAELIIMEPQKTLKH
jgi:hypothetical protein